MNTRQTLQRQFRAFFGEFQALVAEWKKAVDETVVLVNGLANLQFQCLYAGKEMWGKEIAGWKGFDQAYLYVIYKEKAATVDKITRILTALVGVYTYCTNDKESTYGRMERTVGEIGFMIEMSVGTLGEAAIKRQPLFRHATLYALCISIILKLIVDTRLLKVQKGYRIELDSKITLVSPISQVTSRNEATVIMTSWFREPLLDKVGWEELVELSTFEFTFVK